MEIAKKFKAAINRTFSENGGVFWHGINDNQISSYLMSILQDFVENNGKVVLGSLMIGRQSNWRKVNAIGEFVDDDDVTATHQEEEDFDSAIYILNKNLQVIVALLIITHFVISWKDGVRDGKVKKMQSVWKTKCLIRSLVNGSIVTTVDRFLAINTPTNITLSLKISRFYAFDAIWPHSLTTQV